MLYTRYSDPSFILDMDWEDGLETILKLTNKKNKEKIKEMQWDIYMSMYALMLQTDTWKPFEEMFPEDSENRVDNNKSVEDILTEVEDILNMKGMRKIDGDI